MGFEVVIGILCLCNSLRECVAFSSWSLPMLVASMPSVFVGMQQCVQGMLVTDQRASHADVLA